MAVTQAVALTLQHFKPQKSISAGIFAQTTQRRLLYNILVLPPLMQLVLQLVTPTVWAALQPAPGVHAGQHPPTM